MSQHHEQQQERSWLKNQTKALYQATRRANPVVRSLEQSSDTGRKRIAREEPWVREQRREQEQPANTRQRAVAREEPGVSATRKSSITKFPSFMCILLCRIRKDNNGTISSAVEFPALGFNIKGDHMPYDLSATVHHKPTKSGNGHYTAISRSRNLESQEWFMYEMIEFLHKSSPKRTRRTPW
jgi:hypothetical protein